VGTFPIHTAWTRALDTVAKAIETATGMKEGRDLFRYYLPAAYGCAAIFAGDGSRVEQTWHGGPATELVIDLRVEAQHATAKEAEEWTMRLIAGLPVHNRDSVQWLRLAGSPDIRAGFEEVAMQGQTPRMVYGTTIPLLLCFNLTATTV
jgi:hypothetical protein